MLHMLLVILKIIGILLLVLLGLILFAALSILFVPLRYRVWVKYDQQLQASLRLSWFLRLISLRVTLTLPKTMGTGTCSTVSVFYEIGLRSGQEGQSADRE